MIIGGAVCADSFRVTVTGITGAIANGTSVTATVSAVAHAVGGFPPYTYSWTDTAGAVFVQASSSVTTKVQVTGTDTEHTGQIICIVTQANGVATTASAAIFITQGSPP